MPKQSNNSQSENQKPWAKQFDRLMPGPQDPVAKQFAKQKLKPGPIQKHTTNFALQKGLMQKTFGCSIPEYYKTSTFKGYDKERSPNNCLNNQDSKPREKNFSFNLKYIDTLGEFNYDFFSHTLSVGENDWLYWSNEKNSVRYYNLKTQGPIYTTTLDKVDKYSCIASIGSDKLFFSGCLDTNQSFWALTDIKSLTGSQFLLHTNPFHDPINVLTPIENKYMCASKESGKLEFFDMRQPQYFSMFAIPRPNVRIINVVANDSKDCVAVGFNSNEVLVYDIRQNSQPLTTYTKHKSGIRGMAFSPFDSSLIASGGGLSDKTIRLWNWRTGEDLGSFDVKGQVTGIHFQSKDSLVASMGYGTGGLYFCRFETLLGYEPYSNSNALQGMKPITRMEPVMQKRENVKTNSPYARMMNCLPTSSGLVGLCNMRLCFFNPTTSAPKEEKPNSVLHMPPLR